MSAGAGADASRERRRRFRRGVLSEWMAAALLMAKGYRIAGRRVRTAVGEIDLVAVRADRIAFVEVKRRPSTLEAEAAISDRQRGRIRRAADLYLARHPRYLGRRIGFDLVLITPHRWPVHLPDCL